MGGATVGNALSSHRGYLSERANDLTRAMGKDKKDVGSKQVRIRDLNIPARELAQFSVNLDRRPNVGFPVAFYGADADPSLLHSQVTKDFAIAPEKITPTLDASKWPLLLKNYDKLMVRTRPHPNLAPNHHLFIFPAPPPHRSAKLRGFPIIRPLTADPSPHPDHRRFAPATTPRSHAATLR